MSPAALNLLCDYHWPGNVRELENTVERAAVLAKSGIIDAQDIQPQVRLPHHRRTGPIRFPSPMVGKPISRPPKRPCSSRALRMAGGNKSKAAEILAIHRRLIYEKMREHEIGEPS